MICYEFIASYEWHSAGAIMNNDHEYIFNSIKFVLVKFLLYYDCLSDTCWALWS